MINQLNSIQQQQSYYQMSLKCNLETAIHIHQIHLKQLHQVGWAQYRIHLSYSPQTHKHKVPFMAYNIVMSNTHKPGVNQPRIGQDSSHCYSKKFQVRYLNNGIEDDTTYYFKVYMDLSLLQGITVWLTIDLLFAQNYSSKFTVMKSYQATVHKFHQVFCFLPVSFDHFGTLSLSGTYNATLMQYKFHMNQDDSLFVKSEFKDLIEYFQASTSGYRHGELLAFYNYYRVMLQGQLSGIQSKLSNCAKIVGDGLQVKFAKLTSNKKIIKLLDQLLVQSKEKITHEQKSQYVQLVQQDIQNIKMLIYHSWNDFNQYISQNSQKIIPFLEDSYQQQVRQRLKAHIFSHRIKNHDWTFSKYNQQSQSHRQHALVLNKKHAEQQQKQLWHSLFPIQKTSDFEDWNKSIKIFQQIYQTGNVGDCKQVSQSYQHIIVLVHGFQAHRNDLVDLKLCLQAKHNIKAYISAANVGRTEDSIQVLGKRLSIQLIKYLQLVKRPYKLSFIGHSMGGIIIRSALIHMTHLAQHFHAYVSICTPHLGYLYSTSKLVHAGLWLLNTWQKCQSIIQLCMQDKPDLRQCFLYKLAAQPLLNNFKKISFIASCQDQYVPYQSARVQKDAIILTQQIADKAKSEVICEMVDNMLCEVKANQINRADVLFHIEERNLDSFLGRTGHIKFICDPYFIKQFCMNMSNMFL